jgi:hypothetical protein
MMTPLEHDEQKRGGQSRAANQTDADRKFLATLAASRRPLLHDVKLTDDELLRTFREMSKGGPEGRRWLIFLIVGADGRTIRSSLSDETVRRRLKQIGSVIGFMGVTIFGSADKGRAPSIQIYYKPLKKGTTVIEKLDKVSREVMAAMITSIPPVEGAIKTEVGE